MGLINSINKKHENKMKQVTNNEINFSWEDPYLEQLIMYKMKTISCHYEEKQAVKDIVNSINAQIHKYNNGSIYKKDFLKSIRDELEKLNLIDVKYFSYSYSYFENLVEKQTHLILHGPGGIGKSHYVYTLSNKLKNTKIKYMTIYGKWMTNDDLYVFDSKELLAESDRFIIFIDAINEIESSLRNVLISKINDIKVKDNFSIIITYRDNAFDYSELACLDFYEELFTGVDYQQAVEELIKYTGKSIFEYEEILQTNNPLYLKFLYEILKKDDYVKDKKAISSITYILEQYIKNKKCCGIDVWWFVKDIASKMFLKGRKELTEEELINLNSLNSRKWIDQLMNFNFLSYYEYDGTKYYFFVMETYTDYLIARSMFEFISKNNSQGNYDYIKDKIKTFPSLHELFILVIFDSVESVEKALSICFDCGLSFDSTVISKINFKGKDISSFQKIIKLNEYDMFEKVSGLYHKPFNCINYFNDLFLSNQNEYIKLVKNYCSKIYRSSFNIINLKLKNMLYRTDSFYFDAPEFDEYFWFSIWCLGFSGKETQLLASKLLVMLCDNSIKYIELIINFYDKFDELIQENLVLVLSNISHQKTNIASNFLMGLLENKDYTHANNLSRISKNILGNATEYINFDRVNLIDKLVGYTRNKELVDYIYRICIVNKYFFRFRDNYHDSLYLSDSFLNYPKSDVVNLNIKLKEEFSCVKEGRCNGSFRLPEKIIDDMKCDFSNKVDNSKIIDLIFYVIENYMSKYRVKLDNTFDYENFSDTLLARIFLYAENIALGSIYSNYYKDELISYNDGTNFIGYKACNPIEYEYENFNLNSVLPAFNILSDSLDKIVFSIINNEVHDECWVKDINISKENVLRLISPIKKSGFQWRPIVLYFSKDGFLDNDLEWDEHYNFYIYTDDSNIKGESSDRYLSIECPKYDFNINDYVIETSDKNRCHSISCLSSNLKYISENYVILPPASIIEQFGLNYCSGLNGWIDSAGELVIIGNKNTYKYERKNILYSLYMREDFFQRCSNVKYIGFSEKYYKPIGRPSESSFDFEIANEKFSKIYMHYENQDIYEYDKCGKCDECKFFPKKEYEESIKLSYEELLKQLKYITEYENNDDCIEEGKSNDELL